MGSLSFFRLDFDREGSFPVADFYVLSASDYLSIPSKRRPVPTLVWGRLDLISDCLGQGALDAVAVPLDPAELSARILGRSAANPFGTEAATPSDLKLGHHESLALGMLLRAGQQGLSREALSWALWGEEIGNSRKLDVLVSGIRKKLRGSEWGLRYQLKAHRGLGYRLCEQPVDNLWQRLD